MIDALFDLLGAFYQDGNLVQAEWIARSILQAIPDDVISLQFLGLLYYRTDRRGEAMQAFGAAETHPPGVPAPDDEVGSLRASAQCLRAASGQGSALAGAWYDLGLVLFRLRRYQQAIDALKGALAARPDFQAARQAIDRVAGVSALRSARTRRRSLPPASAVPATRPDA